MVKYRKTSRFEESYCALSGVTSLSIGSLSLSSWWELRAASTFLFQEQNFLEKQFWHHQHAAALVMNQIILLFFYTYEWPLAASAAISCHEVHVDDIFWNRDGCLLELLGFDSKRRRGLRLFINSSCMNFYGNFILYNSSIGRKLFKCRATLLMILAVKLGLFITFTKRSDSYMFVHPFGL